MKSAFLYIALLFSSALQGQDMFPRDTIVIGEVVINGNSGKPKPPGSRVTNLDMTLVDRFRHKSIADLISENSPVYVKSYGPGGISTPSLRGTGPGHTGIAWNGINLNNPMPGQFDLSLVPAGFADEVNISYGGGSLDLGNGGFGGIVNMETGPDWSSVPAILVNPSMGSFGKYSVLVKIIMGSRSFRSVTKAYSGIAENDFPYLNSQRQPEPGIEKRIHNQGIHSGVIQEIYIRRDKSLFSARLWFQDASRNLPQPIIALPVSSGETQDDRSFRTMIGWDRQVERGSINVTGAWLTDRLNYFNNLASIDSRNLSGRIMIKAGGNMKISGKTKLALFLTDELTYIISNNYSGNKTRNSITGLFTAEMDWTRWFATRLLITEILHNNKPLLPDFSAGTTLRPAKGKEYLLRASFSRNSRIPTMNDMYWFPGGNPDLRNETGYTAEVGWEMEIPLSNEMSFKGDVTTFRNYITDMIQWIPGPGSYWIAANVKKIRTTGLESQVGLKYNQHNFKGSIDVSYSLTKARAVAQKENGEGTSGNQLIYVPANQFGSLLRADMKEFYSAIGFHYTGRRYVTADNSVYLPAYSLTGVTIGGKLYAGKMSFDISLTADNLFNISYQNIAWYPMPGRSFLFSIEFHFKKSSS